MITPLREQLQELSLYTGTSYWKENIVTAITQDRVIDDNLKRQFKNRTLYTSRLFLLTRIFNILAIGQNNFSMYQPFFFSIHKVMIFPHFSRQTVFQLIM